ncbi:Uncharacterized protein HZ326_27961 [Fusarium oxysporum f. sp. albedinis]|nr:Uncharacterized protein HZ326_27961 [Fusarium oxysporum f. sp. albedinis]
MNLLLNWGACAIDTDRPSGSQSRGDTLSQKILTDRQIAPERSSSSYVLSIEPDLPAVPIRSNRTYPPKAFPVHLYSRA